jgi:hypothetical protein
MMWRGILLGMGCGDRTCHWTQLWMLWRCLVSGQSSEPYREAVAGADADGTQGSRLKLLLLHRVPGQQASRGTNSLSSLLCPEL